MNPVSSVWLMLAKFCLLFGSLGLLNMDNEELICMYTECLAIYLYFQDSSMAIDVIELIEPLLNKIDYFEVIRYYSEKCLALSVHYKDEAVEGVMNGRMAEMLCASGDFHQAIEYYNKVLAIIARETRNEALEALVAMRIGNAYIELSEWKKAIEYFNKCLNMNITDEDKIIVYNGLGIANRKLNNYKEAIKFHKEALSVAQDLDDKAEQCAAYENIGVIYCSRCQYDKAIEYHEKQVNNAKELGMKNREANGYLNLGMTFYLNNDNSKALDYYQKALDIYEVTGDKEGEVRVYRCFAKVSIQMGKYDEAIKNSHRALDMAVKIEDRDGECIALSCLGTIYLTLGKTREAIDYLQKSLNIAEKIHDPRNQAHTVVGLGRVFRFIGNISISEECFREQLKLSLKIRDQISTGEAYTSLAGILRLKGKYSEAMVYLQKSLDIAIGIHNKQEEANIYLLLGELQSHSEAIRCYEKVLTIAKDIKHNYIETLANSRLGALYSKLAISGTVLPEQNNNDDNYQKSEMYLREAIKGYEFVSHHLQDRDDFKISFSKEYIKVYDLLTEVLIQKQQMEEALLVCERGHGRSLSDLLVSKYFISCQDVEALASPVLKYDDVQKCLQRSMLCILFYTMAYRCIIWVLVHNQPISYHIYETEELKSILLLGNEQQFVRERYVQMLVDEAYDKMNIRDMTMNCENRSLDIVKTRGHSDEEEVVVASCSSEQDTTEPSNQTEHPDHVSKELSQETPKVQDNRHPLQKLFDVLVAPVQSSLTEEEIVIVPQGPLYLVPFAALRDSKSRQYLCDTKRIRLAPSITALKTWQECSANYHSVEGALVIGNPTVGKVKLRGEECIFKPLPVAETEAEDIAGRLGVTALTGSQATKEEVKKRLAKSVAVIHIAAHADSQRGEIALAPSESAIQKGIPEEEDYLLTMREVQQIGIRAKLVVLSCCHSGRGDINPEGLVGLSRAFLAAGARAVIASLWAVDDKVTYLFMRILYINLEKGHSASASLQKAMKYIRSDPEYTHPRYWAPFYLIGDDVVTIGN